MESIEIIARGKVQGVGFKNFVFQTASSLQLKGFTLNQADGSVRTIAIGERSKLESLVAEIRKGNKFSIVSSVDTRWNPEINEEFKDFGIRT